MNCLQLEICMDVLHTALTGNGMDNSQLFSIYFPFVEIKKKSYAFLYFITNLPSHVYWAECNAYRSLTW